MTDYVRGPTRHSIGATATKVLDRNDFRSSVEVLADSTNADTIYVGHNSTVASAAGAAQGIKLAGGDSFEDTGEWNTIDRREVWLIAGAANQICWVRETIAHEKPGEYKGKGGNY